MILQLVITLSLYMRKRHLLLKMLIAVSPENCMQMVLTQLKLRGGRTGLSGRRERKLDLIVSQAWPTYLQNRRELEVSLNFFSRISGPCLCGESEVLIQFILDFFLKFPKCIKLSFKNLNRPTIINYLAIILCIFWRKNV